MEMMLTGCHLSPREDERRTELKRWISKTDRFDTANQNVDLFYLLSLDYEYKHRYDVNMGWGLVVKQGNGVVRRHHYVAAVAPQR